MRSYPGWCFLTAVQVEALEMFATKISRIVVGDPNHRDNWQDIAGYATLADKSIADRAQTRDEN